MLSKIPHGHFVLGVSLAVISVFGYPVEAGLLFYGFVKYQTAEYRQIRDTCYQDIKEFLEGYGVGAVVAIIIKLLD